MLLSGLEIRHHEIELFIQNIFKALKFNKTVTEKNENWTESEWH